MRSLTSDPTGIFPFWDVVEKGRGARDALDKAIYEADRSGLGPLTLPGVESSQDPLLARVDASLSAGNLTSAASGAGVGGGSAISGGEAALEPAYKVSVPWITGEVTDEGPARPKPKTKEEFRMRQEEEAREAEEAIVRQGKLKALIAAQARYDDALDGIRQPVDARGVLDCWSFVVRAISWK